MESQGTYVGFWVGVARIKKMGLDELSQTPPIINNDDGGILPVQSTH